MHDETIKSPWVNFMFCWPCISIHLCNKNELHALFILSFTSSINVYMFRAHL